MPVRRYPTSSGIIHYLGAGLSLLLTSTTQHCNTSVSVWIYDHYSVCFLFFLVSLADFGVARVLERTSVAKSFCGKYNDN